MDWRVGWRLLPNSELCCKYLSLKNIVAHKRCYLSVSKDESAPNQQAYCHIHVHYLAAIVFETQGRKKQE